MTVIKIPDYIPKEKYIAIIRKIVIAVGDTPSEVAMTAAEKFPNKHFTILYNGSTKPKKLEYIFMTK